MLLAESLLGSSSVAANYIEDVFSTYLYTGNGSTQTITNGIDLSGKGGLVWTKCRSIANGSRLYDSERPSINPSSFAKPALTTNGTNGNLDYQDGITTFNGDGFLIQDLTGAGGSQANTNGATYVSWTFRKQAKFFDVVTYTGNGANRTIAHSLGSVPGCIMVKRTDTTAAWAVYHRSLANTQYMVLNTTAAAATGATRWNSTTPTSSVFSLGTSTDVNANGGTYVAYLFAHDAGGFGAAGTDNVISCGSYTGNGSANGPTITLGYEPQWILFKQSSASGNDWQLYDSMRGLVTGDGGDNGLFPNSTATEDTNATIIAATATGFKLETTAAAVNASGATYIYIAIRRGPMKTPTSGTSVYTASTYTGAGTSQTVSSGLQTAGGSFVIIQDRNNGSASRVYDTSRGPLRELYTQVTNAEVDRVSVDAGLKTFNMNGFSLGSNDYNGTNQSGYSYVAWQFRRAPGFFDVVCYTGTGASATLNHNLGVSPEMVIIKGRSVVSNWETYLSLLGGTGGNGLAINDSGAKSGTPPVSSVTATTFTLNNGVSTSSGQTYVAYLFATVAGVSKVGSYTGTGTTKQIDCGFTGGARFVLIKRTDSTGDWYVWDSARGIVAGNDPYLRLNASAAEVTTTDYIDTYSAGFEISSTAPAAINANGGTYIFLAIA